MAHIHQPPSTTPIVIGPRDEERRALTGQWLRPVEPDRPDNDVADEPAEWKVFRSGDALAGINECRRVSCSLTRAWDDDAHRAAPETMAS
jgi:hypothetical protein